MSTIPPSLLLSAPSGVLQVSPLEAPSPLPIRFSLIIPTYNERQNIEAMVAHLSQLLDPVLPGEYELIIVDDDSPDRTWEVAQTLLVAFPQLRVMRRQQERGLSTAVVRGWQAAQGEILGVMDGDLQHPPEVLLQLLAAMERGADLAIASRHVKRGGVSRWSLLRRLLSRGAQVVGLLLLPGVVGRVSDPMSGYFLVSRAAIAERELQPTGYKILIEVLGRGQIQEIAEVGYVFLERREGESKVTGRQYLDYLHHLLRLRLTHGRGGRFRELIPLKQFLRFGLVGLSGVVVDMVVLYLLHDASTLGLGLTRSKILAAEVAIINNFFWNDAWTFADVAQQQRGGVARFRRFLKFNAVCLVGLVLNVLLLNLLFNQLQLHYLLANLIAIAVVTLWNFWVNLKLSWRVTAVKSSTHNGS
ncbi:sulfonate ABC transporter permease [Neosynechococcus sphagnicola sy1]|uniref:Dolichol-phosphate mannosyltransferase n=1 Tax=Neosynechococcus sphagnicola sy1 TaxID=1497020 RepID=A0A098TMM4_9CYAN|nr:glycosyltransferase [Neosynechococcus sphagnicola]KGF73107.1 sulfonate ABC transporter permease [Neosynechococcus sphagnicola sy1]